MPILGGVGKDTVQEAQRTVDDIQAHIDKLVTQLRSLLENKRIVIVIEVEDK